MAIPTQSNKPRTKQPRKRRGSRAVTSLEPPRIGWSGLADVIVKRAMIHEQAQSYSPEKAKKIRASEEAVRLEKRERELWNDICSMAAEHVLSPPVTMEGGNSRRPKLKAIVEWRLRYMFTQATSALLPAALLAGPELRPERRIARPRKSV